MDPASEGSQELSRISREKIKDRAAAIWKRKCQSLSTALDDWLQAERELRSETEIGCKSSDQYTRDAMSRIRHRAQKIREEKVRSLRTAFDDWIEAEKELREELKKKAGAGDLFDLWFHKVSARITPLLASDTTVQASAFNSALEQLYVELMAECMT
ncbi:MAG: DUF2934 domain-containing protein [Candidatus Omnitrophica bacterium]|nr:DUF2934 domain-containing protein [Candidatus Omnitrophota bacterium]